MRQSELYEPVRRWLIGEGFAATVVGTSLSLVIPISDLVPMPYKVPDVVGIRDGRAAIVEVEQDKARFFDAFGRCLLWKCTASFVFLAYPAGTLDRAPLLRRLGVGLLAVDVTGGAVTPLIPLSLDGGDLHSVYELHPLDFAKEQQLCRQIEASCV
jgi:hypothetical protein